MVLQKQEPKLRNVKKEGSCVVDVDSQAAGSSGLLGQDRDSFSALGSEGTGLVLWYNNLGWGVNSMKWGFQVHKALMKYEHH